MDFNALYNQLTTSAQTFLPNLLAALAILAIGWVVAMIIAAVVRGVFKRTTIDNRIAGWIFGEERASSMEIGKGLSKLIFYTIMLFVLVAFFQALSLTIVTEPINSLLNQVFEYIPQLIGAGVLLLVAWVLASLLRLLVSKGLETAKVDERLGSEEDGPVPLTKSVSDAVYWLVFLLFLPAILGALSLTGILDPIQGMLDKILDFLPNMITAAILLIVGWFVARLVQRIVSSLLAAIGLDSLGERVGLSAALGTTKLSALIGTIVYVFILIPIAISALNALKLDSITAPASAMLNQILGALPSIFAALVVLAISYAIARLISTLVTNLLMGVGFNKIFVTLGIAQEPDEGDRGSAGLVGSLVMLVIMLFASMEAANLLGFEFLSNLLSVFMEFGGHILLGLIILAIGIYLANIVANSVRSSQTAHANLLALVARVAILIFSGSMALNEMGLGNEIIVTAFSILLGAIGVALAIAFGMGGRDAAARQLEEWRNKSDA